MWHLCLNRSTGIFILAQQIKRYLNERKWREKRGQFVYVPMEVRGAIAWYQSNFPTCDLVSIFRFTSNLSNGFFFAISRFGAWISNIFRHRCVQNRKKFELFVFQMQNIYECIYVTCIHFLVNRKSKRKGASKRHELFVFWASVRVLEESFTKPSNFKRWIFMTLN